MNSNTKYIMTKKTIAISEEDAIRTYAAGAKRDLISACANALKAGACIYSMAVRAKTSVSGIISILDVDVSRRTLYRWANAYDTSLKILGMDHVPDFGTAEWDDHLTALEGVAANMSISRLQLGAPAEGSDIARLDTLQTATETAEDEQEESIYTTALENVESGKWTLIQAMRAVGGQKAKDVAAARRKDPLYIGIDDETKKPVGILPKAVSSLKTGFENWAAFDGESKRVFASLWKSVLDAAPADLEKYL